MRRLSGEDAGFLYMDLPGQPMNSMAIGVLEPSARPLTLGELRAHVAGRLDELPSWRWRIKRIPGNLHHPVAWTPGDPDLETHVTAIDLSMTEGCGDAFGTVRHPDEDRLLEQVFADLAEQHLDPDLPLWRVWLLSGLNDGRQAVVVKYHHALADGVGALATLSRIFSDRPLPPPPDAGPVQPEREPGAVRLVLAALRAHLLALLTILPMLRRTRRGIAAVRRRKAVATVKMPAYVSGAPRTLLNEAFGPGRRYTRVELPLAGIKQTREQARRAVPGVTLNDVLLGVVAGACVRYLAAHQPEFDPLSSRPLLTTVPVADEGDGAPVRQHGNRFWSFTTSLATDVADPVQRLRAISLAAREGKVRLDALGVDLVADWLDRLPPAVARRGIAGTLARLEGDRENADASILVSNLRGPHRRWSLGGREFLSIHLDGPPSNGVGINVMAWSYADRLALGVLGYDQALAHPADFSRMLGESFEELLMATADAGDLASDLVDDLNGDLDRDGLLEGDPA